MVHVKQSGIQAKRVVARVTCYTCGVQEAVSMTSSDRKCWDDARRYFVNVRLWYWDIEHGWRCPEHYPARSEPAPLNDLPEPNRDGNDTGI